MDLRPKIIEWSGKIDSLCHRVRRGFDGKYYQEIDSNAQKYALAKPSEP